MSARLKDLKVKRIKSGSTQEVLAFWCHLLNDAFARSVNEDLVPISQNFTTDPYAANCRAAIRSSLESVGIVTSKNDFAQQAGILSTHFSVALQFKQPKVLRPIADLLRSISNFHDYLNADWVDPNRHIGPFQGRILQIGG